MTNYQEVRIKLTNTQLKKIKFATKNKAGEMLRMTKRKFQDEKLSHELFLTKRQKAKIRNIFPNSMLMNLKLSKLQISKIIQSG